MRFGKVDSYILLGGGILLLDVAKELRNGDYDVLVVTSPRHMKERLSEVERSFEDCLVQSEIDYLVSENVNTDTQIHNLITSSTVGLSLGAAWIFRKKLIDRFSGKLLNLHGTRLPEDRGGGIFSWRILRDNKLGGCSLHQVDTGVDTGPIIKYAEFIYPEWCRIPKHYTDVYVEESKKFLSAFFDDIERDIEFSPADQLRDLSSYWPRLSTDQHGYLDWDWNLLQIDRFVRAFDEPYMGASTFLNGNRVFLKGSFVDSSSGTFHPFQNGMVYRTSPSKVFVATEDGTLGLGNVTNEKDEDITTTIQVGDRFYTPNNLLEKAKQFRAVFTPKGLKV